MSLLLPGRLIISPYFLPQEIMYAKYLAQKSAQSEQVANQNFTNQ